MCPEHVAAKSRGHGDSQRAEEHAGGAGQQGDGGGPVREHGQRPDNGSVNIPNTEPQHRAPTQSPNTEPQHRAPTLRPVTNSPQPAPRGGAAAAGPGEGGAAGGEDHRGAEQLEGAHEHHGV